MEQKTSPHPQSQPDKNLDSSSELPPPIVHPENNLFGIPIPKKLRPVLIILFILLALGGMWLASKRTQTPNPFFPSYQQEQSQSENINQESSPGKP